MSYSTQTPEPERAALIVVRVLHMFKCRRNDYAPSAVPKSNSRFRLMLRTCPACESVPCDGGGSVRCDIDRMAQTHVLAGLAAPPGAIGRRAARWARLSVMLLDQQLSGERVSILPGGSNEA